MDRKNYSRLGDYFSDSDLVISTGVLITSLSKVLDFCCLIHGQAQCMSMTMNLEYFGCPFLICLATSNL